MCLSPGQGDLREAPGRPTTVLGKGPPLCSEPGMQQGGRLVHRTHSGAMWAEVHPLSSLSCVLETLTSAFEHKQLMAYVCVCVLGTPTWLCRGPPSNHSHHSLAAALSSHRKSAQGWEPPLICRLPEQCVHLSV